MPSQLFEPGAQDVLYLIDLSGYVFRAYHAIAPLSSPAGEPTQAVFGTVNMLERLFRQCRPALVAVAQDSGKATFRKELYPDYKANRPEAPEDLRVQLKRVEELLQAWGLCTFKQPGVEADDVIATLVRLARQEGLRVVVVSADKDLMALVTPEVLLWDTMRDKVIGPEEVRERFGVAPEQMRDLLALTGDSSDNVPGVPQVGPKTAQTLLTEHGSLDGIYAHLDRVGRPKLRATLEEHRQQAYLSRQLVTLREDCDLTLDRKQLARREGDAAALKALYRTLGFERLLAALEGRQRAAVASNPPQPDARAPAASGATDDAAPSDTAASANATPDSTGPGAASAPTPAAPSPIDCILTRDALERVLARAAHGERLSLLPAILEPKADVLVGIGLATADGEAHYLPLAHRYVGAPPQLPLSEVAEVFRRYRTQLKFGAHDGKRALVVGSRTGLPLPPLAFDSLLATYLLDPEADSSLDVVAQRWLGGPLPDLSPQLEPRRGRRLTVDELPVEVAAAHYGHGARAVARLWPILEAELATAQLTGLLRELELPLSDLLAELELRGVLVDTSQLSELGTRIEQDIRDLEQKAHACAGKVFNVHSPRQLEVLLFDELGLKPLKRTKTARSTDAATLEALSEDHELPAIVLDIRKLAKLKSTYIDALPSLVRPETGRIHTVWGQATAATGRLASSDPNLQNIPIRSELGRAIRRTFVAPKGCSIVSADYSQIELRVLAHLSGDEVLVDAFERSQDIHLRTAMEIFGLSADEVTPEHRRRAKAVNFGVVYGQGEGALSKSLGIERSEAARFIATYFQRYSGVRRFLNEALEQARRTGATTTLLGRRRLVPDLLRGHGARRQAAERIAMNTPIQGSAADLLKLAMLALRAPVTPGCRMIMTVHDELVFEVPNEEVEGAKPIIRQRMESVYALKVPLVVSVGHAPAWSEAH